MTKYKIPYGRHLSVGSDGAVRLGDCFGAVILHGCVQVNYRNLTVGFVNNGLVWAQCYGISHDNPGGELRAVIDVEDMWW